MPTVWCRYIELTLQRVGSDATALQADLKKRLDAALERVKPLSGVEVKIGALALLRQTPESNPRMAQRYSDSGLSAPPEVWKGTQQVFCVDHDMDGLQAALTELQKQGAVLTEMHFDLTPETWTRIRKELAGEAVSALRTEAAQVAESMGLQVHRYLNVQLNEEYDQRQIQARRIRFRTTAGRWSSPTATSTSRW